MKILIISDIHENFHNLILALKAGEVHAVEQIICLGDLMNTGIAKVLAIQAIPVFMIWGNNDGEKVEIMQTAFKPESNLKVSINVYDFLELDGRKIFLSHYNDLAEPMARSGLYDAIFYGHNHKVKKEKIGRTLVVNPGELCAQKTGDATIAIYDTLTNDAEIITLENSITLKSKLVDDYFQANAEALGFRSDFVYKK
jgi:putative phosphoesterase